MQEIQPLRFRRYVLRNRRTGAAVAIVEAGSIMQAEGRGSLLQTVAGLFEADVTLVAERADLPMHLPTFLDTYFRMLETPSLKNTEV